MQLIQGCIKENHSISQAYQTSIECILHKYCNLFFNIKHLEIDIPHDRMYVYIPETYTIQNLLNTFLSFFRA